MMRNTSVANIIKIDASDWTSGLDFYNAILPVIGAPEWHGTSVNALIDSMVWGDFNKLVPPYVIEMHNTSGLPAEIMQEVNWTKEDLMKARDEFKRRRGCVIDIDFNIID